uniref:Uncharacterized LOC103458072 n=1 Tax=Poecilia reticulata TaxID=8081 RepID=A0A3P9N0X2_POERE
MASAEEASRPFAGLSDVSISEEIPVEGDIAVPVGPSTRDDEFSTLDEPVKETIVRDLRAVGNKFIHVLYPKRSSALLRDWDLWGPLLLCVTLALLLQGGAADSDDQGGPQFAEQSEGYGLDTVRPVPRNDFHAMLLKLKKLIHLSWGMKGEPPEPLPDDYLSPPNPEQPGMSSYGGPALTSLELVDYPETILPENALRSLTSLRSLAVRYRYIREGIECRLRSWLTPLRQLESLTIIGGNSLATYTTTIPPSVTRLTLRVAITLKDMDSIAPKVPGLEHLDIEQNRSSGSLCRRIPMLFPHLKTLRIRFFRREPEKDLLSLHKLRHLVQLELLVERSFILRDYLNGHPWPSPCVQELINELRDLSENRITVITTMRQRNLLRECDCLWEGD